MKTINLTQNQITIVDDDIYEWASKVNWCAQKKKNKFYAQRRKNYKLVYLAREIMNAGFNQIVDHINGNTLDNRRENLRICNIKENSRNRSSGINNSSDYKGVRKVNQKWRSSITVNYKEIHLGYFFTKEDAAKAYNEAAIKYFNNFAKLNSFS